MDVLNEDQVPLVAFVWRPEQIGPPVAEMARRAGCRAVFDLSTMGTDAARAALRGIRDAGLVNDIKISADVVMDASFERILKDTSVQSVWVELGPACFGGKPTTILNRLEALSENCRCYPIIGDLDILAAMIKDGSGIGRVVLKGCEASGFVGAETTLVLHAAAKAMLRAATKSLDIFAWGGIWTPEAAAAFLSTGTAGIVFESVHWLTDLVAMDDLQRRQLAKLRMDSSSLVGLDLQVPCRLFNKGNSQAFKEVKAIEDSLGAAGITDEGRRSFGNQVRARFIQPLESHFTPDEVIPLGVEAAFAAAFAERFGAETETAVKAFMEEIRNLCRSAEARKDCFVNSPVAREMGIKYPFIQGAMACVTDVPEFALRVADAGGLPTIALGMMDMETGARKLEHLPEIMGGRPYAVNVVSLVENPFREAHLAWIKQHRPRFVWIAGGDISPIRELLERGIEVAYIAPDAGLLKLALKAGVRYVVCEGYEAGGHVGEHSTLTLAQMVLDIKRREPSLFQDCRVILAGGIFNRETAFMAALLGADAIQMGTAYLATREIVDTGALTALYRRMIVESPPGGTVVSGQCAGLRVRSLKTPIVAAAQALEREFAAGRQDEQSFRAGMEAMAAGSLFAAARGVDRSSGAPLDERACLERGQFMGGACAGLIGDILNLESFHREIAEGALAPLQLFAGAGAATGAGAVAETAESPPDVALPPVKASFHATGHVHRQAASGSDAGGRIAVTGMSILNALGNSPEEVWDASVAMKSGITLVPPSRWDHGLHYDSRPRTPDKTYCKVGAFVDFHVSRNELGIPPQDFRTMSTATKITLWLADRAIRASGILDSDIPRERVGVIISQNSGETAGTLTDIIIRSSVHDILAAVNRAVPLTPEQARAVEQEVKSGRMTPDDTTLLGRLNCAAAGFICNRYGFMGPSHSVSAACASSLVALHSAIQMIRNGVIDAAVVGGGEESLANLHFLEFSALGALYGLSGRERPPHESSRPFDAERDGMVLGEGGGMIVIERESLARARGARLHAIVTGMGASNSHSGMVESSSATQELAIRSSFRGLPYGPNAVDLVECHATSTRQGDVEEVRALKTFFNSSKRTVLTSLKSQTGHTLGAAGINNLIRGVMAMKARVFPATLNYEHPDPEIDLRGTGMLIAAEPLDWPRGNGQPRRFQVDAFGFGGFNYIVQLEQAMDDVDTVLVSPDGKALLAGKTGAAPDAPPAIQGVSFFRTEMNGHNCRMAVVSPSEAEAFTAIEQSAVLAEADVASPKATRALARQDIFIGSEAVSAPPLAFVFPGQGAQYQGMGRGLYESVPVIKEVMDRAAAAVDFDLPRLLFHDHEDNLRKTRWQQPAMFALEQAIARHLFSLGIHPQTMAGHSLGELSALCLAGVYSLEDGARIVNMRAICMERAAAGTADPGIMAAVDAPLELLKEMTDGQADVHIGNINSPKQVVLSGDTAAVNRMGDKLKTMGYRFTRLRVGMAFHSPLMRVIHDELDAYVASLPLQAPRIPVISNTSMAPYPSDPVEIRRILMANLESTVHWVSNVRSLWSDYGIRLFVEVGPGDILSNLIGDTLPESACLQTCLPPSEYLVQKKTLAQLFAHGHLKVRGEVRVVPLAGAGMAPAAPCETSAEPLPSHPVESRPASPDEPAASLFTEPPEFQGQMEELIHIIMDATGFDRDEIQPDMDLRRDLSIRSSRLPIIMDAAERHFGITIELEDFMQVRTVRDVAQRISAIVARQEGVGAPMAAQAADIGPARDGISESLSAEASLKRLTFDFIPVEPTASAALELRRGESVLIVGPGPDDGIAQAARDTLRRDNGVEVLSMPLVPGRRGAGGEDHDILTAEGAAKAAERISELASLVGMVITLPENESTELKNMSDAPRLLKGLFPLVKAFLQSPTRKFVLLIHSHKDVNPLSRLLAEGLLGLFLTAAREHPEVQFRTLEIDQDTDMGVALRGALDKGRAEVEIKHREGRFFTSRGHVAPMVIRDQPSLLLSPGDVVVMSGGATGISAHLARGLAPFSPRLVFLGRTSLEPDVDLATPRPEPSSPESASDASKAREIAQTLAELRAAGIEAAYHTCDVTNPEAVRAVMGEVVSRYGRIDGIIHGAGVLRDGWLEQMSQEDFARVVDVKFLGAWNLFAAAEKAGLRFFVGLSSVAAIQGNPGQANYTAANRMMAALLRYLGRGNNAIRFKALMLPPIAGAGMAENPEIRELLERKGVAYIHTHELAALFCRELFIAPEADDWVMFMRTLPAVKTVLLSEFIPPSPNGEQTAGTVVFSPEAFPMTEAILDLDLRHERLEASRTFSRRNDLWIADHRPLKSIEHPLVSAAMLLETFMEAARLLYPHLRARGVRRVRFLDIIPCPPEVPRLSRTSCRRADAGLREVVCEVTLAIQDISPAGSAIDRFTPHCAGQVLLDGGGEDIGDEFHDFPVRPDELRGGLINHKKLLKWYKTTGLDGRYRVLEAIDGSSPETIRGRTTYRESGDFAHLPNARYQYSPYLFEALMQLVGFHMVTSEAAKPRPVLPVEVGELRFRRQCRAGEQITLEARLRSRDKASLVWDARGLDDQGRAIMQIRGMRMQWVAE